MTDEEIKELNEIVSTYKNIDCEMLDIKEKVETFQKRNNELIEQLKACEKREQNFTSRIREKYGEMNYNNLIKYIR